MEQHATNILIDIDSMLSGEGLIQVKYKEKIYSLDAEKFERWLRTMKITGELE